MIINSLIGSDYISGPYNVTFPAGTTRTVLDISVTNDNILEVNESFSLMVNSAVLPSDVASVDQTTITIIDNDGKLICVYILVLTCVFKRINLKISE